MQVAGGPLSMSFVPFCARIAPWHERLQLLMEIWRSPEVADHDDVAVPAAADRTVERFPDGRQVVGSLASAEVLPGRGTLVIMEACALSSRQRAASTAWAVLPLPGIVG